LRSVLGCPWRSVKSTGPGSPPRRSLRTISNPSMSAQHSRIEPRFRSEFAAGPQAGRVCRSSRDGHVESQGTPHESAERRPRKDGPFSFVHHEPGFSPSCPPVKGLIAATVPGPDSRRPWPASRLRAGSASPPRPAAARSARGWGPSRRPLLALWAAEFAASLVKSPQHPGRGQLRPPPPPPVTTAAGRLPDHL